MSLIWGNDTVEFVPKCDPDARFTLKKELSSGDDDAAWAAATRAGNGRLPDLRATVTLNRERVRRSIVAWSYTHDGAPVEVSDDNIDRLDRVTFDELVEKVNELNPFVLPRTPLVKRAISLPTSTGTESASQET